MLALKWRPVRFGDVVGQPHIVRTLTNALAQGKVSHAYLFAGPRGVGKTTCARILAKAVNCEKASGGEPCGTCPMCVEIGEGRALDVIEIDAASTGKTEDIRDLRDLVRLAPARARRKVFVIDEVHSMSGQAFNALLKTLEEPPPHVIFILATTDVGKVPATVHSRCQRFEFHPLGPATIFAHLKKIAEAEGIKAEEAALNLIAKAANGAMRDGQMLLEQAASYSGGKVTLLELRDLLGLLDREWVEKFLEILRAGSPKDGLTLLDELIEAGHDPLELLSETQEELRDALMARLGVNAIGMASAPYLADPARRDWFGEEDLLALIGHVRRAMDEISAARLSHPRVAAELAFARLLRRERPLSWEEVEEQLARLESALSSSPGASPAASLGRPAPAPAPRAQAVPPAAPLDPEWWPKALEKLKAEMPGVYVFIKDMRYIGLEGDVVRLSTLSAYHREGLSGGEMKDAVEAALSSLAGRKLRVQVSSEGESRPAAGSAPAGPGPEPGPPSASPASAPRNGTSSRSDAPKAPQSQPGPQRPALNALASAGPDWVKHEPLVEASLDIFKARILELKRPGRK